MSYRLTLQVIFASALLSSACLEDVTVGIDKLPLVGEPAKDAAVAEDAGQATLDSGAIETPDEDAQVPSEDAGVSHDAGAPTPDAGQCAPSDCEILPPELVDTRCPDGATPSCERNDMGMCVSRCPEPEPDLTCGGVFIAAKPAVRCGTSTFCLREVGHCSASELGLCTELPTVCVKESAPVCACDNKTYDNACEAHRLGLSLLSQGACP